MGQPVTLTFNLGDLVERASGGAPPEPSVDDELLLAVLERLGRFEQWAGQITNVLNNSQGRVLLEPPDLEHMVLPKRLSGRPLRKPSGVRGVAW